MLKARLLTAIVLLLIFVPVTLFAPLGVFGALIGFVVVFAAWEWARLLKFGGNFAIGYALLTAVLVLLGARALPLDTPGLYRAAALFWVLAVPFAFVRRPTLAAGGWRAFLLLAGIVLFNACWHALVTARAHGVPFVLSLLLLVWLADIGAYFAGRRFGRRKLAVTISPGKTWEGAIGGWLLAIVVALLAIVAHPFDPAAPTFYELLAAQRGIAVALLTLTVLVIFSVLGDLFESLLKRQAGVKDSSALLPGHGGVLDRIDALLPVLPIAMLFVH
ncbi:phosphatidate cytidylyltransferase [Chitinasiproducens palmae]|uniref:Phosphatidate cytidylyltransferase n=1 Tax=Chitinasiproducens palmae TaxID=1770053 RepID=A0A1H2PLU0_9BURK|nr:phosphatidate cytidylyltransferase [Chitinasiproducens palmae]SDV47474.1 phosphatidate cytidylyltransferase [Chitinasiproducens palmae]